MSRPVGETAPPRNAARSGAGAQPEPASSHGATVQGESSPVAAGAGSFDGDWASLVARLPLTGFVRNWANKSEFIGFEAGVFSLRVGTRALADDKPMREKLRAAIEQYLGRPVRLAVQLGELAGASVAAIVEKNNDERQKAAEVSIMGDAFVREVMDKTGAVPTDIRPS